MSLNSPLAETLKSSIRDVPDFPKQGILFKDITPVLKDPRLLKMTVEELAMQFKTANIQQVAGIESRGFIFGVPVALKLNAGFVPVRKKGKLPAATKSVTYALEYGEDSLEIHVDAVQKGTRVLVVDDLLATGGTAQAVCSLVESMGGIVVGVAFVVELVFLHGSEKLKKYAVTSLVKF